MQRRTNFTQAGVALVLWSAVVCAVSACKAPDPEGGASAGGNVSGGSSGSGGSSNPDPTPGKVDDTAGFRVVLTGNSATKYVIHDSSDTTTWTTPCKIDPASVGTNASNVFCTIEAQEGDLYYQGLHFNYNVPTTMCTYLEVAPYGYYNQPVADGDTTITYWVDKNGTIGVDANTDGTVEPANVGKVWNAPNTISTITAFDKGKLTCAYDLSGSDLQNCCTGSYALTIFSWDPTANAGVGGYKANTTTDNKWGGNPTSCYAGPFKDLAIFRTAKGVPLSTVYYTDGIGHNKTMDLDPPDKKRVSSNVYLANYVNPADHGGPALPAALITPVISEARPLANPYYDFICMDPALEVKARLRLTVRDWNMYSEWAKKGAGDANLTGFETAPYNGFRNNDRNDWRDLELLIPGVAFPYELPI